MMFSIFLCVSWLYLFWRNVYSNILSINQFNCRYCWMRRVIFLCTNPSSYLWFVSFYFILWVAFHFISCVLWHSNIFFIDIILYAITKKPLPNPRSQKFTPMFSSKIYVNFALTVKSNIHLNYFFVCVVWGRATHLIFYLWKSNCYNNISFVYLRTLFSIFREWKGREKDKHWCKKDIGIGCLPNLTTWRKMLV